MSAQPIEYKAPPADALMTIEAIVLDMRALLRGRMDMWPLLQQLLPNLTYPALEGFSRCYKGYANPSLKVLARFERACRIIDPNFLGGPIEDDL